MEKLYCNYFPSYKKFYCGFNKNTYPGYKLEFTFNNKEELFEFAKNNFDKYEFHAPILVANEFNKKI